MRIINRTDFLNLPANTLFATYDDGSFGEVTIKGKTLRCKVIDDDYYIQSLIRPDAASALECDDLLERAQKTGESFALRFDVEARDGYYHDENQLYAIFERDDLHALYECLRLAINATGDYTVGGRLPGVVNDEDKQQIKKSWEGTYGRFPNQKPYIKESTSSTAPPPSIHPKNEPNT